MEYPDDKPPEWNDQGEEDDFVQCALNVLKHLHRHVREREEYRFYIPEVLSLIDSHRNMPGNQVEF